MLGRGTAADSKKLTGVNMSSPEDRTSEWKRVTGSALQLHMKIHVSGLVFNQTCTKISAGVNLFFKNHNLKQN